MNSSITEQDVFSKQDAVDKKLVIVVMITYKMFIGWCGGVDRNRIRGN